MGSSRTDDDGAGETMTYSHARGPAVLILGGTREAHDLAGLLAQAPGPRVVRVGSFGGPFGGPEGLADRLVAEQVGAVVDASSPFAPDLSVSAAACAATSVPLVSLVREPWEAGPDDAWHEVDSLAEAARVLPSLGERAFVTTGRPGLAAFAGLDGLFFLIRCADPPDGPLPRLHEILISNEPLGSEAERDLMRKHSIDVLVTRNTGGSLAAAKLIAAADLGLPVVMIRRPERPDLPRRATAVDAAEWVREQLL
jgi:precorrin-6A/cobalt-precorrin-6A reductase